MRKNFLTIGVVMTIAWISLAPLSLLFIANIASSPYPFQIRLSAFFLTLLSWILLPMGTGLLWRKESSRTVPQEASQKTDPPVTRQVKDLDLEALREMQSADFSRLCLHIFERMWPGIQLEETGDAFHLYHKKYLLRCDNRRTFFDSRDVQELDQELQGREADGGYFFVTGVFSHSAYALSESEGIELIDGQKLLELRGTFLSEKGSLPSEERFLEKRRSPRLSCDRLPFEDRPSLELGTVYQRTTKTKARILNISAGGVCIERPPSEALPTFFQLSLKVPFHADALRILGEVVWQRPESETRLERSGLSFVSMTDDSREKLNAFLEKQWMVQQKSTEK